MAWKVPPDLLDTEYIKLQLEESIVPHMPGGPFEVISYATLGSLDHPFKKSPNHGAFSRLIFHWIFLSKRKDMTSGSFE